MIRLEAVPIKAPYELEKGKNMPSMNTPSTGPPSTLEFLVLNLNSKIKLKFSVF